MTITYTMDNVLYLNITNKCCNSCDFCIRNYSDTVGDADNLWLEHEPTIDEIIADIATRDLDSFKEVVFCGYGEPCERIDELVLIAKHIKAISKTPIRINTNGQANLMHKKDITPLFLGVIDIVSISLNAKDAKSYQDICHSTFGEECFDAIIDFAKRCKKTVSKVVFTIVDTLPKEDIELCREIANTAGIEFRVRELY